MGLLNLAKLTKEHKIDWREMIKLMKESTIPLREPMTLAELYDLMRPRWNTSLHGNFSLKKFLFHNYIEFDEYFALKICVSIPYSIELGWPVKFAKNKTIHVDPGSRKPKQLSKTQWAKIEAVGGYMEAVPLAIEHYRAVRLAIIEIVHDKVASNVAA